MAGKGHYLMHKETEALLEKLLVMLAEKGEEPTYQYIREEVLCRNNRFTNHAGSRERRT